MQIEKSNNDLNLDEGAQTLFSDGENMNGSEFVEVQTKKMK